jgi:hypothetical protein
MYHSHFISRFAIIFLSLQAVSIIYENILSTWNLGSAILGGTSPLNELTECLRICFRAEPTYVIGKFLQDSQISAKILFCIVLFQYCNVY